MPKSEKGLETLEGKLDLPTGSVYRGNGFGWNALVQSRETKIYPAASRVSGLVFLPFFELSLSIRFRSRSAADELFLIAQILPAMNLLSCA